MPIIVCIVSNIGGVSLSNYIDSSRNANYGASGVRPLVTLQSNIKLTKVGTNTWDISDL